MRDIHHVMVENDAIIVPVPIHPIRYIIRGYNQSALMGEKIAKRLGKLFIPDFFISKTMFKQKTKWQRVKNRKDKIKIKNKYKKMAKDKQIIIIDDVYVTGSTITACINEIKKHSSKNTISIFGYKK